MAEKMKNDRKTRTKTYELAGLTDRFAASVIDGFLLLLPLIFISAVIAASGHHLMAQLRQFVLLAAPVSYYWFFWTRRKGQTPGKFALGIRVIKADGSPISDADALIRAIGYHVSAMLFGLGFVWAFFDGNNQTWHDKIARTYVVRNSKQRKTVEVDVQG